MGWVIVGVDGKIDTMLGETPPTASIVLDRGNRLSFVAHIPAVDLPKGLVIKSGGAQAEVSPCLDGRDNTWIHEVRVWGPNPDAVLKLREMVLMEIGYKYWDITSPWHRLTSLGFWARLRWLFFGTIPEAAAMKAET